MKLLLIGKDGQVGFELQRSLAGLGEVVATGRAACDLANQAQLRSVIRAARPDVIVNAGAYTAVDQAESEPGLAFAINAQAPGVIGEEAERLKSLVIHFSTDYVFNGKKHGAYDEEDQPDPLSVYGRSKLEGELALERATARHLILRTSWVVGAHGANFTKTMLRLAAERHELRVVADQFGAPTSAALLADVAAQLAKQYSLAQPRDFAYGLYHVAAAGTTNWCDYARFVIGKAAAAGVPLKASPRDVFPILAEDYPAAAKRPANSRLDTRKLQRVFGLDLPDWESGLCQILEQVLQQR